MELLTPTPAQSTSSMSLKLTYRSNSRQALRESCFSFRLLRSPRKPKGCKSSAGEQSWHEPSECHTAWNHKTSTKSALASYHKGVTMKRCTHTHAHTHARTHAHTHIMCTMWLLGMLGHWRLQREDWCARTTSHLIKPINQEKRVKIHMEETSVENIQVRNGLEQGCYMAPVLFNLYTHLVMERWLTRIREEVGINIQY